MHVGSPTSVDADKLARIEQMAWCQANLLKKLFLYLIAAKNERIRVASLASNQRYGTWPCARLHFRRITIRAIFHVVVDRLERHRNAWAFIHWFKKVWTCSKYLRSCAIWHRVIDTRRTSSLIGASNSTLRTRFNYSISRLDFCRRRLFVYV